MRIQKALNLYLEQNTRVKSQSTLRHYTITLRQFQQAVGSSTRHLTNRNAAKFVRWLQTTQELSDQTICQRLDYLRAFWNWAAKMRYCREFPVLKNPPVVPQNPEAWSIDEIRQMLAACRRQTGYIGGVPAADWWCTIHGFWYRTGERISATLAARWENFSGDTLLIFNSGQIRLI